MSGDHLDIFGKSYHNSSGNPQQGATIPVLDLIAGLLGAPSSAAGAVTHASASAIQSINSSPTGTIALLQGQQDNGSSGLPRAGINWLLFNDRFECVGYGTSAVGAGGSVQDHYLQDIEVERNGYLYVYCSNESGVNVFFDNLQVVHTRGPLLEETHYYPFGLTMAGISSKAAGKLDNKKKYNHGSELQSEEFSDGSGLELYETKYRSLDPQLGRFWQVDPLAQMSYDNSLYTYANNNPVLLNDPLGLQGDTAKLPNVTVTAKAKVQVFVWSKEVGRGKDVGHTAIRINNVVYGYYPTDENGDNILNKGELLGSKGEMHKDSLSSFNSNYRGQEVTYYQLNLTPEQAKKLEEILEDYKANPGKYNLLNQQCTSVAVNALVAAGVKIGAQLPAEGMMLHNGMWLSPNNLKGILGSGYNKELVTRIVKFIVGK